MFVETAVNMAGGIVGSWVGDTQDPWDVKLVKYILEECEDGVYVRHIDDTEGEAATFYSFNFYGRDGAREAARIELIESHHDEWAAYR